MRLLQQETLLRQLAYPHWIQEQSKRKRRLTDTPFVKPVAIVAPLTVIPGAPDTVILASRQYPQGGVTTRQPISPLMETFAKLIGTAISGADCKYLKLHFPIDSRLRGNDGVDGAVILASRQYPQGGGTGIDRYGTASPRFMGDLIWIGM